MTVQVNREIRLRARIDKVTRERDRYRAVIEAPTIPLPTEPPATVPERRRCVYCGEFARARACADHRDLLRVDPHYEGSA